jgi:hypothetical protein
MGGFVLYVDGQPRGTLTPGELLQLVCVGLVDMPTITEAEIKHRSKSDLLSKCVAIFQLLWFIIQIFVRYEQKLLVTLLEIDTLGVAALTCISYGLWFNKPKDVRLPYIVHWRGETAPPAGSLDSEYVIVIIGIPGKHCSDLHAFYVAKDKVYYQPLSDYVTSWSYGLIGRFCAGS